MKVPPTNMNGFAEFEDDHYYNDGGPRNGQVNITATVQDYPAPLDDADFSEYMWMENEEEFDKEVLQRLEEEELMEQCMLQHMLDNDHPGQPQSTTNGHTSQPKGEVGEPAKASTLNPHAAEFVPSWGRESLSDHKST